MKKPSWVVFFIALLFILIIPFGVLLIFARSITGAFIPVISSGWAAFSNNSAEWSNFGSLLGGLFGLSSALATMITLGFVIYQSEESIKRSDKQTQLLNDSQEKQDAKIEKNNQNINNFHSEVIIFNEDVKLFNERVLLFNKAQEERNTFDKYKLHVDSFNNTLDDIVYDLHEFYTGSEVKIIKKSELYHAIFPLNSFEVFSTYSSQDFSSHDNIYEFIAMYLKGVYDWMNMSGEVDAYMGFLQSYVNLKKKLNIKISLGRDKPGAIYQIDTGEYLFTVDDFQEELDMLHTICNRLAAFSHNHAFPKLQGNPEFMLLKARLLVMHKKINSPKEYAFGNYRGNPHCYKEGEVLLFELYIHMKLFESRFDYSFSNNKVALRMYLSDFINKTNRADDNAICYFLKEINDVVRILSMDYKHKTANLTNANEVITKMTTLIREASAYYSCEAS